MSGSGSSQGDHEQSLNFFVGELAQARDLLKAGGLERHHDRLRMAQARNRELAAKVKKLEAELAIYRPRVGGSYSCDCGHMAATAPLGHQACCAARRDPG